jgi:peptidoglycan/xylan/chitin deacetylase (PgdA/CDA1 family)
MARIAAKNQQETGMSGGFITTYEQWRKARSTNLRGHLRETVRTSVLFGLSLLTSPRKGSGWLRFPYYHHVFDDERRGFERQLRHMRDWGDFVPLDEAADIIGEDRALTERLFCISFDDGFKNCLTNALPILKALDCPAAFFIQTDPIGLDPERHSDQLNSFYRHAGYPGPVELLNWENCRAMLTAGMTIGSHTISHANLGSLDESAALEELTGSKAVIERKLGIRCHHFACPWGIPGVHFRIDRDPGLAIRAGYTTFLINARGLNRPGDNPLCIRRDHLLANWPDHQLRYLMRGT